MNSTLNTIEIIYDTYSSMVYGISLEISPTQREAKQILISTFQEAHKQSLILQNSY